MTASGSIWATYTYDAWGEPLQVLNGSNTALSSTSTYFANVNPLRYRGYYYDTELGFYYLQSRYYDPSVGRFVNADGQFEANLTGGLNLFAYCDNNPVMGYDPTGKEDWQEIANFGIAIMIIGLAITLSLPTGGSSLVLAGVAVSTATLSAVGTTTVAAGLAVTGSALVYAASNGFSSSHKKTSTGISYSTKYSGNSKFAKNGVRVDYEYYVNRAGNVHITYKGIKYMLFSISQKGITYYSGSTVVKGIRLITDEVSRYVSKYINTVLELGGW